MENWERELDEIEIMILKLSNDDKNIDSFRQVLANLRKELEHKQGNMVKDISLQLKIAELSSQVSLYSSGVITDVLTNKMAHPQLSDVPVNATKNNIHHEHLKILTAFIDKAIQLADVSKTCEGITIVEKNLKN